MRVINKCDTELIAVSIAGTSPEPGNHAEDNEAEGRGPDLHEL